MSAEKPTVHLLPFEMNGDDGETEDSAAESLFESLASSTDETPGEASEDEDEDAEEAEESDTDDDAEDEETESDDDAEEGDDDEDEDSDDAEETEESEEGEDDEDDATPDLFTVKVNGEEKQVPLDELKAGYSRTQDYTRKTQELARERTSTVQAREQYTTRLRSLEETIDLLTKEPNWEELRRTRGEGAYAAARADWDQHQRDLSTVRSERARLEQESFSERAEAERLKLLDAVPEWSDPEKAKADGVALVAFARDELGLTDEEIKATVDHRIILLMREAMAYRAMQKQGGDKIRVKTKAKKPAKVVKPGAKATPTQKPNGKKVSKKSLRKLPRSMSAEQAGMAFLESGLFD